jgi:hypothetical protein
MRAAPDDPMPPPAGARGRHRRTSARRGPAWRTVALVTVVVLVVGGAGLVALLNHDSAPADPLASPTVASTPSVKPTPSAPVPERQRLDLQRSVRVRGTTVTVDERYTLRQGTEVVLAPANGDAGPTLRNQGLRVVAQDGTEAPFTEPVALGAGRTLALRGLYQLRYCPDLVPLAWPGLAVVKDRDFVVDVARSDEPLRTSAAVCPKARSKATQQGRLRGTVTTSGPRVATVRLARSGRGALTVRALGAPSGLPLDGVGPACGPDCVTRVRSGRPARVEVRPVEGCPRPSAATDRFPLLVQGSGRPTVVVVRVTGLGRWFARACR